MMLVTDEQLENTRTHTHAPPLSTWTRQRAGGGRGRLERLLRFYAPASGSVQLTAGGF